MASCNDNVLTEFLFSALICTFGRFESLEEGNALKDNCSFSEFAVIVMFSADFKPVLSLHGLGIELTVREYL